jgi:hypothetical protein
MATARGEPLRGKRHARCVRFHPNRDTLIVEMLGSDAVRMQVRGRVPTPPTQQMPGGLRMDSRRVRVLIIGTRPSVGSDRSGSPHSMVVTSRRQIERFQDARCNHRFGLDLGGTQRPGAISASACPYRKTHSLLRSSSICISAFPPQTNRSGERNFRI